MSYLINLTYYQTTQGKLKTQHQQHHDQGGCCVYSLSSFFGQLHLIEGAGTCVPAEEMPLNAVYVSNGMCGAVLA